MEEDQLCDFCNERKATTVRWPLDPKCPTGWALPARGDKNEQFNK